jgi:hypothetical protein
VILTRFHGGLFCGFDLKIGEGPPSVFWAFLFGFFKFELGYVGF